MSDDPRIQIASHAYVSFVAEPSPESVIGNEGCRVYWGSHGCRFDDPKHEGLCECNCCHCPPGHHNGVEAPELVNGPGVICVAKPPYYGPDTRFYGEDAAARGLPAHDEDDEEAGQ